MQTEWRIVLSMAVMRVLAGAIEITAALLMIKFARVSTAMKINATLGLIGPTVLMIVSTLRINWTFRTSILRKNVNNCVRGVINFLWNPLKKERYPSLAKTGIPGLNQLVLRNAFCFAARSQPLCMENSRFINTFVGMGSEIITLSLNHICRYSFPAVSIKVR